MADMIVSLIVTAGGRFEVWIKLEEEVLEVYLLVKAWGARNGWHGRGASLWTELFEKRDHVLTAWYCYLLPYS